MKEYSKIILLLEIDITIKRDRKWISSVDSVTSNDPFLKSNGIEFMFDLNITGSQSEDSTISYVKLEISSLFLDKRSGLICLELSSLPEKCIIYKYMYGSPRNLDAEQCSKYSTQCVQKHKTGCEKESHFIIENDDKLGTRTDEYTQFEIFDLADQYGTFTTHTTFITCSRTYIIVKLLNLEVPDLNGYDQCFVDFGGIQRRAVYGCHDIISSKRCDIHLLMNSGMNTTFDCLHPEKLLADFPFQDNTQERTTCEDIKGFNQSLELNRCSINVVLPLNMNTLRVCRLRHNFLADLTLQEILEEKTICEEVIMHLQTNCLKENISCGTHNKCLALSEQTNLRDTLVVAKTGFKQNMIITGWNNIFASYIWMDSSFNTALHRMLLHILLVVFTLHEISKTIWKQVMLFIQPKLLHENKCYEIFMDCQSLSEQIHLRDRFIEVYATLTDQLQKGQVIDCTDVNSIHEHVMSRIFKQNSIITGCDHLIFWNRSMSTILNYIQESCWDNDIMQNISVGLLCANRMTVMMRNTLIHTVYHEEQPNMIYAIMNYSPCCMFIVGDEAKVSAKLNLQSAAAECSQILSSLRVEKDIVDFVCLKCQINKECSETVSRLTETVFSLGSQGSNISIWIPEKLPLKCKSAIANIVDTVHLEECVRVLVKVFFKTFDITLDQREDGNTNEQQIKSYVDILVQQEKISVEFYKRNIKAIDLKDNKRSNHHHEKCFSHNRLPQPYLSRDAIVGFVEGNNDFAEHKEVRDILAQLASDNIPGPHITMKYEMLRLCTMKSFPGRNRPFAIRIIGAGFYYAGHRDQVICYCCGCRKDDWVSVDIPLLVHQKMAPSCTFFTSNSAVNIPIKRVNSAQSPAEVRLLAIQTFDGVNQSDTAQGKSSLMLPSCEQNQINISSGTLEILETNRGSPCNYLMSSEGQNVLDNQQTSAAIIDSMEEPPPKYPQYTVKDTRINSFQGWPAELHQRPEEMAECGFYYAGFSDCVRCFYCGVGLRHWMSEDDPWIEHARWSSSCGYVYKIKGGEFVSLVQMAVEIAEREEAAREKGAAKLPPENKTKAALTDAAQKDSHNNIATNSTYPRNSTGNMRVTGGAVGGATESTPSHGNAETQNYLLTDAAQSVLDMGYQPKLVQRAIERVLMKKGTEDLTGPIIMEAVFEIEDEEKAQCRPQRASWSAKANGSDEKKANDNNETKDKQEKQQGEEEGASGEEIQADLEKIRREHRELCEATLCKICLANTISVVFLPCGHLVTCPDCAPAMRKCPICRALIKGTVKTFFG